MVSIFDYFQNLVRSFNPLSYSNFADLRRRDAIVFFFVTIFFAVTIMLILSFSWVFGALSSYDSVFSKITKLDAKLDIKTTSPIYIPEKMFDNSDRFNGLIIDTSGTALPNSSRFFYDGERLYYDFGNKAKTSDEISNVMNYRENIKGFIVPLAVILFPTILVFSFIIHSIALFLIIMLLSLVLSFIFGLVGMKRLDFGQMLNINLFASVFLSLGIIIKPIFPKYQIYFDVLFIIYVFLGAIIYQFAPSMEDNRNSNDSMKKKNQPF